MLIEGSGIPLPSEITMPFSGFLKTGAHAKFQVPFVILVGTVAEVCGAFIGYGVGFFGGRPLLERYGKWVLIHRTILIEVQPGSTDLAPSWSSSPGCCPLFGRMCQLPQGLPRCRSSHSSYTACLARPSGAPS